MEQAPLKVIPQGVAPFASYETGPAGKILVIQSPSTPAIFAPGYQPQQQRIELGTVRGNILAAALEGNVIYVNTVLQTQSVQQSMAIAQERTEYLALAALQRLRITDTISRIQTQPVCIYNFETGQARLLTASEKMSYLATRDATALTLRRIQQRLGVSSIVCEQKAA